MDRILPNSKSIVISALVALFICGPAQAQEFNAGFFGGVTASQVDGDLYSGFNKLGLTAGAFVNREIDYNIYWQLEIKYVSRGAYKGSDPNDPSIFKVVYRYAEIPLSVHYLYAERVQAEIGISPDVLLHYASYEDNIRTDPALDPSNHRFGMNAFAGIYYWFTPAAGVGFRYTYSVITFRDLDEWHNYLYRGYFHNVLCLTAAYRFRHP